MGSRNGKCRSQPLSSVSRKQRYNILDFPTENRVPTGMLLAPIGNSELKDCILWTPLFSSLVYIQTCDRLYISQLPKTQKSHRLHPVMGNKICGIFFSSTFRWNVDQDVSERIISNPHNIRFIFNNALIVSNNDNRFAFFIEFVQQLHNNISVFLVK